MIFRFILSRFQKKLKALIFEEFTLIPSWQTHIRQYSQPTSFGTCIKAKKTAYIQHARAQKSYPKHTRKSFLAFTAH